MCGADNRSGQSPRYLWGSPPRVRSRPYALFRREPSEGITSACAEQTPRLASRLLGSWDHLRVCGADIMSESEIFDKLGSPPRVRSRRHPARGPARRAGITSACAEETAAPLTSAATAKDHLRASACAEQTIRPSAGAAARRDHLRVCGADRKNEDVAGFDSGSPPRVRSRLGRGVLHAHAHGITSACAEQTPWPNPIPCSNGDHLRVCGADSCILLCSEPAEWRGIFDLRTAQGELMP